MVSGIYRFNLFGVNGLCVNILLFYCYYSVTGASLAARAAEQCGFFLAGLTPMLHPAYGLTFQFLNNVDVDFDSICAHGPTAPWHRDTVAADRLRIENGA